MGGEGMATQRFTGVVSTAGGKAVIVLPFDPNEAWGPKARHHTAGTINGRDWRGPLTAEGGQYLVALGPAWRRDNGIEPGAAVTVELVPEGPQADGLAPDLAAALADAPDAQAFFDSLATFYRKGYLRWLDGARRPEARKARIQELIALLRAGQKQR